LRCGEEEFITCSYIVFATGAGSQVPIAPTYKNEVRTHYSLMTTLTHISRESSKVKFCTLGNINLLRAGVGSMESSLALLIQVCSLNSINESSTDGKAHDVAEDMLAAGLSSVTMVQRSKTC